MYIRTSVFVSFKRIQYSTWCQNRGCICISSTRRTYRSNPAVSCIHSVILDKKHHSASRINSSRRGEERFQYIFSVFEYSVFYSISSVSTCNSTSLQSSRARKTILHIELILPQEISKKYFNYKAHPVHIDTGHSAATVSCASKHSTWQKPSWSPYKDSQASSNSTHRNSILSSRQHPHTP